MNEKQTQEVKALKLAEELLRHLGKMHPKLGDTPAIIHQAAAELRRQHEEIEALREDLNAIYSTEPVYQWRIRGTSSWIDGKPPQNTDGLDYFVRTLYTAAPQRKPMTKAQELDRLKAYVDHLCSDEARTKDFLCRAGIIDESGNLTEPYRELSDASKVITKKD